MSGSSENQSRMLQRLVYYRLRYSKRGTEEGLRSARLLYTRVYFGTE